jgi:hypothetical protein
MVCKNSFQTFVWLGFAFLALMGSSNSGASGL